MRILHIDEMFHPFAGYQINVLPKFQVHQGNEVCIITLKDYYPRVSEGYDNSKIDEYDKQYTYETGVKVIRLPIWKRLFGRPLFSADVFREIKMYDPDIIMCHGNGTFTSIQILLKRKKYNKPIIFDSHMLELAHESRFHTLYTKLYKRFITPIIIKEHIYVIKTADDPYLNEVQGIPIELTPYLGFGTDVDLFHPDQEKKRSMRERLGIKDNEIVFLYTGKVTEAKGGELLAKTIHDEFNNDNRRPVFVIVADYKGEYEKKVESILKSSENRVILVPLQKYIDLPAFYQLADVMIFAKQCSLSFFDAQACGVPVILENIKINMDRVNEENGCTFVSGCVDDFREKIHLYLGMDEKELKFQSKNAFRQITRKFSYNEIAINYTKQMEHAIEEYKSKHKE